MCNSGLQVPAVVLDGISLPKIIALELADIQITPEHARALSTTLANSSSIMHTLKLDKMSLNDELLKLILGSASLSSLRILSLSHNPNITSKGFAEISKRIFSPSRNTLREICLKDCFLFGKKLIELMKIPMIELNNLDISMNLEMLDSDWTNLVK